MNYEPKHYTYISLVKIGIRNTSKAIKIHTYFKKNWKVVTLTWALTFAVSLISYWITGWLGIIVGMVLSIIPFYFGINAVTKIIEKEAIGG